MYRAASVSGYYFAHPQAQYFNPGKISKDQVVDYAGRKNQSIDDVERLLNVNLNYKYVLKPNKSQAFSFFPSLQFIYAVMRFQKRQLNFSCNSFCY
jgi:hypothetical protein